MRRGIAVILVALVVPGPVAFSHETSLPMTRGQLDASLFWYFTNGAEYRAIFGFTGDDTSIPTTITMLPLTSGFNFAYAGSIALFEYAIVDAVSLGVRANLLDLALNGVRFHWWALYGSVYGRLNLLTTDRFLIHLVTECQFSPLFATPKSNWMGDGLVNVFNTLSLSLGVVRGKKFCLFSYLDLKTITSLINTAYMADQFKPSWYLDLPPEQLESMEVVHGHLNRLAVAVGIDIAWGPFLASVGVNIPLLDFSLSPRLWKNHLKNLGYSLGSMWPSIIEFGWRFRFR